MQRVTSDVLQEATYITSNRYILLRLTSYFLKRAPSATSDKRHFATSNDQILQHVTSDFRTSNEKGMNLNK